MILIEQATKIPAIHKSLPNQIRYALEHLRVDQLRAALSICHLAGMADPEDDNALTVAIDYIAGQVVPNTIEMLTDKLIGFGREQRQLRSLLTANGYMKPKKDPSKRLVYMQEATDKIMQPYLKMVASLEEKDAPNSTLEYYPSALEPTTSCVPSPLLEHGLLALDEASGCPFWRLDVLSY
jgi:hypothetical protein